MQLLSSRVTIPSLKRLIIGCMKHLEELNQRVIEFPLENTCQTRKRVKESCGTNDILPLELASTTARLSFGWRQKLLKGLLIEC